MNYYLNELFKRNKILVYPQIWIHQTARLFADAHREYKCTKNKERRKRNVTRDLLASILRRERGLNLKDR